MGAALNHAESLSVENCCTCGVAFAMPSSFQSQRRSDKQLFYCPNGHGQSYTGETDAAKAKRLEQEKSNLQKRLEWAEQAVTVERERVAAERKKSRNLRVRVKNGVCPCCSRTFQNLQRHIATKHPDFGPEAT